MQACLLRDNRPAPMDRTTLASTGVSPNATSEQRTSILDRFVPPPTEKKVCSISLGTLLGWLEPTYHV